MKIKTKFDEFIKEYLDSDECKQLAFSNLNIFMPKSSQNGS